MRVFRWPASLILDFSSYIHPSNHWNKSYLLSSGTLLVFIFSILFFSRANNFIFLFRFLQFQVEYCRVIKHERTFSQDNWAQKYFLPLMVCRPASLCTTGPCLDWQWQLFPTRDGKVRTRAPPDSFKEETRFQYRHNSGFIWQTF